MRLLTIAVAILSAAAFAAAPPAPPATAPVAAHHGPRLIIKDADPKAPPAVTLAKARIEVQMRGPLAQTSTTLTFHNSTDRVLEGEFEFPLPENAAVAGYALDVNGTLVDGVPVEKQRAREIFESEVRKGVDPGILEQTRGNNFRTRIYPIPAKGDRTVRITCDSEAPLAAGKYTYALPLEFPAAIADASINISVMSTAAPEVAGLPGLVFEKESAAGFLTAHKDFHNIELSGSLVISVPAPRELLGSIVASAPAATQPMGQATLVERREKSPTVDDLAAAPKVIKKVADQGEYYFLTQVPVPKALASNRKPSAVGNIALYWDASLSREKADKSAEFELIKQLAASLKNVTIDVVTFRNTADGAVEFDITNSDASALLKHLETIPYDGATDLGTLKFVESPAHIGLPKAFKDPPANYRYALVFTDGLATLGNDLPAKSSIPVFTVTSDARADFAVLRAVAAASPGGAFLNLQRLKPEAALAALAGDSANLISITGDETQIADVYPRGARPAGEPLTITGRLLAPEATLTLNYGYGGQVVYSSQVTLKRAEASDWRYGGLVSHFWAQQKIADLSAMPDKNADELLAIGREFNMVTPNTSLVVLERVEQYLQYRIVPPKTHPDLYKAFVTRIEEEGKQQKAVEEAKITRVLALWQERVKWYDTNFKPTREQLAAATRPDAGVATGGTGGGLFGGGGGGGGLFGGREAVPATPPPAATVAPARPLVIPQLGLGSASAVDGTVARGVQDLVDPTGANAPVSSPASITLKEWDPKTPYLEALMAAKADQAYAAYLAQRQTFGASPAFFLDCSDFFFRAKQDQLAIRILSNIAELKLESAPLLRIAAYRFLQTGQFDLAIDLFEKARHLRPDEPQSDRDLALAFAQRASHGSDDKDRDGLMPRAASDYRRALELYQHVVMNPWERFPEIEVIALMEANALLAQITSQDAAKTLTNPFDPRLVRNLPCDLRIALTWDADSTDIDLHVIEPTGAECDYSHNRTLIGGLVSKDFTDGYGPEEYCIKKALPGNYKIRAHFYGSRQQTIAGPVTVQATVITNFGKPGEKRQSLTLRLTKPDETVDIGVAKIGP